MIGFLLFVFGTTMLLTGFFSTKSKPVSKSWRTSEWEKKKYEQYLLKGLTEQFGKEKAEQIMSKREYYIEQNQLLRPQGRRYWYNDNTGDWELIFKDNPLF